MSLSACITDE
jgi:hypothetical protein